VGKEFRFKVTQGGVTDVYSVFEKSKARAYFILGLVIGLDNLTIVPNATEFKITEIL
jgi:hypothetical protein